MNRLKLLTEHLGAPSARGAGPAPASADDARPRIAVLVSFWGATSSHADWIVTKLIDGYWWEGAYKESRVEVASLYIHQHDTSLLGQRVAESKGIPVFESAGEALTLGGDDGLAVDGVVIVAEHGNYHTDLKGHWLLPRWWIYQQVVEVFEDCGRSVPVRHNIHPAPTPPARCLTAASSVLAQGFQRQAPELQLGRR